MIIIFPISQLNKDGLGDLKRALGEAVFLLLFVVMAW